MSRRSIGSPASRRPLGALLFAASLASSCAGLIPAALELGGSLLATAAGNYSPAYGEGVRELLTLLAGAGGARAQKAPQKAASAPAPAAPLVLEVALLRQAFADGRAGAPIQDGDVLTFRPEGGSDRFKVFFRPGGRFWVYVILVDGTGRVQPLFPAPGDQDPVEPGRDYFLPEGDNAFEVDEHRGVETIWFVASRERREDLEATLARLASLPRAEPAAPLSVTEPPLIERGVAARRPGAPAVFTTRSGDGTLATTTFLSELQAADLVLTRWFDHR